jgi:hypothetical protein
MVHPDAEMYVEEAYKVHFVLIKMELSSHNPCSVHDLYGSLGIGRHFLCRQRLATAVRRNPSDRGVRTDSSSEWMGGKNREMYESSDQAYSRQD